MRYSSLNTFDDLCIEGALRLFEPVKVSACKYDRIPYLVVLSKIVS